MAKITKEQKALLLKQGLWAKCARPDCPNPASKNRPGSYCGAVCNALCTVNARIPKLKKWFAEHPELNREWTEDQKKKQSYIIKRGYELGKRVPRKYSTIDDFILTSKTITLGKAKAKAIKTGLLYASAKGKFNSYYKKGHRCFRKLEIPYRNEFDLMAFKSLDENPLVKSWIFLDDVFSYSPKFYAKNLKRKIPRHIVIDFKVEYMDGTNKLIFLRPEGIKLFSFGILQALEEYCLREKLSFEVWTKENFSRF